ncbi:MAG: hypothetical protein IKZ83_02340, partial [Prevotella sp.]|nr:hypothetical protein [Prevotella sp.]
PPSAHEWANQATVQIYEKISEPPNDSEKIIILQRFFLKNTSPSEKTSQSARKDFPRALCVYYI